MKKTALAEVAVTSTSHNPDVLRQVLLEAEAVPGLTNFSQAVFTAGQVASGHAHHDMWEVFFVREGRGRISVEGSDYELVPGTCVVVEPGERHEVCNPHREDLTLLYFGLRHRSELESPLKHRRER